MVFSEMTLLLVAGGRSTRMGQDKRWLQLQGKSFIELMLEQGAAAGFSEICLCVEADRPEWQELAKKYSFTLLLDRRQGQGPMEGIANGLAHMKTSHAAVISCDMPFFNFTALLPLMAEEDKGSDAVLPSINGRWQPLAGIYGRGLYGAFQAALEQGMRKLGAVIKKRKISLLDVTHDAEAFLNVNTPAALRMVRGREINKNRETPIVSVMAPASDTGKTTFIEGLLPLLAERGIKAGVIKFTHHEIIEGIEGKDSSRFLAAGAGATALVAPDGVAITERTQAQLNIMEAAARMPAMDVMLTESRTRGIAPVISLWRGKAEPLTGPEVALLLSSQPETSQSDVNQSEAGGELFQFSLDDVTTAEAAVEFLMGGRVDASRLPWLFE